MAFFLRRKLKKIRAILLDVDGVLTDARLFYGMADTSGAEGKAFSAQDGFGITRAVRAGIIFGIVTGRSSPVVARRAAELGIAYVWQGVQDKFALLPEILHILKMNARELMFIGDDAPDREIMQAVGLAACPRNATREARQVAALRARRSGGYGAVREIIDRVLCAQKRLGKNGELVSLADSKGGEQ